MGLTMIDISLCQSRKQVFLPSLKREKQSQKLQELHFVSRLLELVPKHVEANLRDYSPQETQGLSCFLQGFPQKKSHKDCDSHLLTINIHKRSLSVVLILLDQVGANFFVFHGILRLGSPASRTCPTPAGPLRDYSSPVTSSLI